MGLCVNKKGTQYMGILGYPVARGIVRDARAGRRDFAAAEKLFDREYIG